MATVALSFRRKWQRWLSGLLVFIEAAWRRLGFGSCWLGVEEALAYGVGFRVALLALGLSRLGLSRTIGLAWLDADDRLGFGFGLELGALFVGAVGACLSLGAWLLALSRLGFGLVWLGFWLCRGLALAWFVAKACCGRAAIG
jgi:hypothetical protein